MELAYAFKRASQIDDRFDRTSLSFSPDLKRQPTYFSGELRKSVAFREAISALHDIVVSDLRFKPKDKTAYKEWAATQELVDLAEVAKDRAGVAAQIESLTRKIGELQRRRAHRMAPFYRAQKAYFDYLYKNDRDAWIVLDPVITVHPDEVFFECFSQDESTYGRLGASLDVFKNVGTFACGTTNIDYSTPLYEEFQKIRSYKTTRFEVDPSGFEVKTTGEETYEEKKIDLPDSWVRGFLQVSSAMALPARSFELHPMDLHNLCFVLRRKREKRGPRALRWVLTPGEPIRAVFEPWDLTVVCARSPYLGKEREEIRVWGRRRLLTLERLIAITDKLTVHLLGQGLPSFYVADLGDMSFTLGLSGWTRNDWATAGNFDLLAPRADTDDFTKRRVFEGLKTTWFSDTDALAKKLDLPRSAVLGALSSWTQAGRAMYDLNKGVYRVRELAREPLPMDKLRFSNEREEKATRFLDARAVTVASRALPDAALGLFGTVKDGKHTYQSDLTIDADGRLAKATCTCNFFQQNKLLKGPCEHMLATRLFEGAPLLARVFASSLSPPSSRQSSSIARGPYR
ncbi:MAG: SWIM zinc finger family protein [Myxococcales bacterium]|nr:SWIM zinc finger family protein [Myxococcales bacterium]